MAVNTNYLRFEAKSMLDFLKQKINEHGTYTDQIYSGSNLTIVLETLSAMFEVLTYNLNFQASESTFNGVQIYENMLKIVNMLGYKARPTIASTIHGTLTGNIYLDKLMPQITTTTKDISELVNEIQNALIIASNPKVISRDLTFGDPTGTSKFVVFENAQVYPEFTNLVPSNIFYWVNQSYTNESEMILNYLKSIWSLQDLKLDTTIDEMLEMTGIGTKEELIQKYRTLPTGLTNVPCNFRVSSNDADNFITTINGGWNSYFVTSATTGERNEQYNITALNASSINISDGTFYAAVYNPARINVDGIQIFKSVSNLRNYSSVDKVFEAYVDINKCITIKFGDGVYGQALPQDYSITLFFIVNSGKNGEIAFSAFNNNQAELTVGNILQRTKDSELNNIQELFNRFIYDNVDISAVEKSDCAFISKLITGNNLSDEYTPRVDIFFNPSTSSSKFQPLETIEEIRANAPAYVRTNDRVINKNDLEIILKRDYVQYIYDTNIMNNFDYMSKFYNWLYTYDSLSKDVATNGYKFSDSCNFNDIYIWLKGYTNYPINDFVKKTIERNLQSKKILTAELVFLDAITTYFYPYVGSIDDDIDWLLYAMEKYRFLIKNENATDKYYKKWKTINDLFDKQGDTIIRRPTKKLLNYILSGESSEIKVDVNVYRDANINENMSTIKSNVSTLVNKTFNIESNKLGQSIKLNDLNESIGNVSGIRRIKTTKSRNVNIYTDTGPVINDVFVYNFDELGKATPISVIYDSDIDYPKVPEDSYISFNLDVSSIEHLYETPEDMRDHIKFYIMQLSTGIETELTNVKRVENTESTYKVYLESSTSSSVTSDVSNDENSIFTDGPSRKSLESAYSIYAKCSREVETDSTSKIELDCYSNKIRFSVTSINKDGEPSRFKLQTYVDNFSDSAITLKDTIDVASSIVSSEPIWEISDSAYSLSFAKFTNNLINARDFSVVGAGYVTIEDFCFPALYKDITSIITVNDEQGTTFGVNF